MWRPAPRPVGLAPAGLRGQAPPSPSYLSPSLSHPNHRVPLKSSRAPRTAPQTSHGNTTVTLTKPDTHGRPHRSPQTLPRDFQKDSTNPFKRREPFRFVRSRSNADPQENLPHPRGDQTAANTETTRRSSCPGDGSLLFRPGFRRLQSSPSIRPWSLPLPTSPESG